MEVCSWSDRSCLRNPSAHAFMWSHEHSANVHCPEVLEPVCISLGSPNKWFPVQLVFICQPKMQRYIHVWAVCVAHHAFCISPHIHVYRLYCASCGGSLVGYCHVMLATSLAMLSTVVSGHACIACWALLLWMLYYHIGSYSTCVCLACSSRHDAGGQQAQGP